MGLIGAAYGISALADQVTTTVEKEQTEGTDETEGDGKTKGQQGDKEGSDSSGRQKPKPPRPRPRPIPDGGTEDRPPGYDALREQGVPEATIEDWHEKGYDLKQMSQALETYREHREEGGNALRENREPGDLAEILAESEIEEHFSDDTRLVHSVDLYGRNNEDNGEFDYVVLNQDGTVIAVVEVKHANGDAGKAETELRDEMRSIDDNMTVELSDGLNTEQFKRNSNDIRRITVGPSSHERWIDEKMDEKNLPRDYFTDYDYHLDLSQDEIKALAAIIAEEHEE